MNHHWYPMKAGYAVTSWNTHRRLDGAGGVGGGSSGGRGAEVDVGAVVGHMVLSSGPMTVMSAGGGYLIDIPSAPNSSS